MRQNLTSTDLSTDVRFSRTKAVPALKVLTCIMIWMRSLDERCIIAKKVIVYH